jgi:hypothetical protein
VFYSNGGGDISFIHARSVDNLWSISRSVAYSRARQGLLAVRNVTRTESFKHAAHPARNSVIYVHK